MAEEPKESVAERKDVTIQPDALLDLIARLDRSRPAIINEHPHLARTVESLSKQANDPDKLSQPGFQHAVAYALEDLEKTPIGKLRLDDTVRAAMTRLAGSAPGVANERVLAMLQTTADLKDAKLVRELREFAVGIGAMATQSGAELDSRIDAIENRLRLAQRPVEERSPQTPSVAEPRVEQAKTTDMPRATSATSQPVSPQPPAEPMSTGAALLNTVLSGFRRPAGPSPGDPSPTDMSSRLSAFERRMSNDRDQRVLEQGLKTGRLTLEAVQDFENNAGASIMNRIRDAAKTVPGGTQEVLAEMSAGGRFADIRESFNRMLTTDRSFRNAHERAVSATQFYSGERSKVEDIVVRRDDGPQITGRFDDLDAAIGNAAAAVPSKQDGASLLKELSQKTLEIVQNAVERVSAAIAARFSGQSASHSPSA